LFNHFLFTQCILLSVYFSSNVVSQIHTYFDEVLFMKGTTQQCTHDLIRFLPRNYFVKGKQIHLRKPDFYRTSCFPYNVKDVVKSRNQELQGTTGTCTGTPNTFALPFALHVAPSRILYYYHHDIIIFIIIIFIIMASSSSSSSLKPCTKASFL
jgi:hypothetical protein